MEGYAGHICPPGMYVRALYDYYSDDHTSLNFQREDIIQVLTQLESGWWDGVLRQQRGWFPSNYCIMVDEPEARLLDEGLALDRDEDSANQTETEPESDYDYEDRDVDSGYQENAPHNLHLQQQHRRPDGGIDQEEGAFWIPKIENGELYYVNTLTGASAKELPMEAALPGADRASRDPAAIPVTDDGRAAPEILARGVVREYRDESNQRDSYISEGASPSTSMESLSMAYSATTSKDSRVTAHPTITALSKASHSSKPFVQLAQGAGNAAAGLSNESNLVPLTWNQLLFDMRRSIDRFRNAVNDGARSDIVKRAEDISDQLRLLLAAGSGTTDSHSGHPSIISANKELYTPFRHMMSCFSKLVLNSHIAAGDMPPSDYDAKCINEADGVLHGVLDYVAVAREQRGEEIIRLIPGFVNGRTVGGFWRGNGLIDLDGQSAGHTGRGDEYEAMSKPNVTLTASTLLEMRNRQRNVFAGVRRLDQKLVVRDKLINRQRHTAISRGVIQACEQLLLDCHRPWISYLESIDLSPLGSPSETSQLVTFIDQKQRIYDVIAELSIACQAIGAPLADEWSAERGSSLEDRVKHAQFVLQAYERSTTQTTYSMELLLGLLPTVANGTSGGGHTAGADSIHSHQTSSSKDTGRSLLGDISHAVASPDPNNTAENILSNADSSKVKRFFGDVPVASPSQEQQNTEFFLRLDYEGEVRYDREKSQPTAPVLRGGTLMGLVEQLTRHDLFNHNYVYTFLLTYQSFTTASELFELLVKRWAIQPPPGLDDEQYSRWAQGKQYTIRLRVVNVLKNWMEYYWVEGDDATSQEVLQRMYSFTVDTVVPTKMSGHVPLLTNIEQRMRGDDSGSKLFKPNVNIAPPPILPKNMRKMKYNDIDPTEYARQLTIIDFRLYIRIKHHECLHRLWNKKSQSQDMDSASQIKTLINHSNHLTNWVADTIVSFPEPKKRAAVIRHFVAVAEKCLAIYNYSALTAILAAFGSSPIHRLNKTWSQVDKKTNQSVDRLRTLMSSVKNFANYRDALHSSPTPCIPFLGVYLTDLTFIDEANPNFLKKSDLINFGKRSKIAEVIREIQQFQNNGYNLKAVPELQDYILNMMQQAPDVSEVEMYERSLKVEPREREDEKIARLLTESGYI